MSVDLVGLGQVSLDRVVDVAALPRPGGKARLLGEQDRPGGQVATALLAASRLGLRCAFLGAVGDDAAADASLAPLAAAGVDLTGVVRRPGCRSRHAWVIVEGSGERTILEGRDPTLSLPAPAPERIARARALLLDLEHPAASRDAAERAGHAGIPVIVDVDERSEGSLDFVRSVDFPIVSESFSDELSSGSSATDALRALCGPRTRMAVITRGALGAIAWLDGQVITQPARAVDVMDTTGAGDAFRGAFAWALLAGQTLEETLAVAVTAASLSCRGHGAQGGLASAEAIEAARNGRGG